VLVTQRLSGITGRGARGATIRAAATGIALALGIAAVFVVPRWESDLRLQDMGVFFIAILGLNIVTGYTGQISLGHSAFMAVGGYTTAILIVDHGVRDLWTIPIAALVGGLAGLLVGLPALRLSGLYLAIVTFGLAVAMPEILKWDKLEFLANGSKGFALFGNSHLTGKGFEHVHVLGYSLSFSRAMYYLTWAVALLLLVIGWVLLRGTPGRAFRAVRDSEVAAASSGVNLAAYKTFAFALSASYAAIAGSLSVMANFFLDPQTFPARFSLLILVGAVVARLGSLWGIVAGAAFVEFLPDLSIHISDKQGVPDAIYGASVVAIILLLRYLTPLTRRLYTRS